MFEKDSSKYEQRARDFNQAIRNPKLNRCNGNVSN